MIEGVIRATDASGDRQVKPFLDGPGSQRDLAMIATSDPAPQRSAVVDLMETLALRDAEISGHADALAAAYAEGEAAGRIAAEDRFEEDREAALKALEDGIVAAREQLADALTAFETLALAVAVEAVDKLTAHPDHYRTMLTDTIVARVREVEAAAVVSISVSRSDFPDTREVAALSASLGSAGDRVQVSDDQDAGDCTMTLTLGTIEFGVFRHWSELNALLAGLGTARLPS